MYNTTHSCETFQFEINRSASIVFPDCFNPLSSMYSPAGLQSVWVNKLKLYATCQHLNETCVICSKQMKKQFLNAEIGGKPPKNKDSYLHHGGEVGYSHWHFGPRWMINWPNCVNFVNFPIFNIFISDQCLATSHNLINPGACADLY